MAARSGGESPLDTDPTNPDPHFTTDLRYCVAEQHNPKSCHGRLVTVLTVIKYRGCQNLKGGV